ncbi:MAG: AraC family transcriptional regulator [Lachnospiraceae bacterium]|nr:AraC family transcriptional regulator [Lachnospiraceae bacterium]
MKENSNPQEIIRRRGNRHVRVYINHESLYYPPHWHTDVEVIAITEGTYRVRCSGTDYPLEKGDILMICPSTVHEIFPESPGSRIYIQADLLGPLHIFELDTAFLLLSPAVRIRRGDFPPDVYDNLWKLVLQTRDLYFSTSQLSLDNSGGKNVHATEDLPLYGETMICAKILEFTALVGMNAPAAKSLKMPKDELSGKELENNLPLLNACGYIAEHFTEQITLNQVAEYVGFSKYYFERIFKQFTDMTFYQYLIQKRISFAQELLTNRSLSVTEIAMQTGFSSSAAFARAFRQATGYAPSEFRSLNESQNFTKGKPFSPEQAAAVAGEAPKKSSKPICTEMYS